MADNDKPLKHLKFREFSNFDSSSTQPPEIRQNLVGGIYQSQTDLANLREDFSNSREASLTLKDDLDDQKNTLATDPKAYYAKMLKRYQDEIEALNSRFLDKTDEGYASELTTINAKYALALNKDMLEKNPASYTSANFDRLEREESKNNQLSSVANAKYQSDVAKLNTKIKSDTKQLGIFDKNPEAYAKLSEVQKFTNGNEKKFKAAIDQDSKGEPCLAVFLSHESLPYGFMISDGKITFNQDSLDKMTVDSMKEILEYLDRRGIKGITLPDDVDKKLEAMAKAASESIRADDANNNALAGDDQPANGTQTQENLGGRDQVQDADKGIGTIKAPEPIDYKKTKGDIDDWIFGDGGLNKENGFSGFKNTTADGYDVWTIYDQGNYKNEELDGKVDKDGYMKVKYAFKIYSKVVKRNGKDSMELSYSMPNGKKIPDGYAKGIARMLKKSGFTHANFPKGLPEEDEGTFRIACASSGIVPKFKNLSDGKIKKMLDEASSKLSDKELLEYKLRLAEWMEVCAREDSAKSGKYYEDHKNATLINNLKGEYQYQSFRDMYEKGGGIRDTIEDMVKENKDDDSRGVVKVFAATSAAREIFDAYKSDDKQSIDSVMKSLGHGMSAEEFTKFKADFANNLSKSDALNKMGYKYDPNKPIREMRPAEASAMLRALAGSKEQEAEQLIAKKFKKSVDTTNSGGQGDKDSKIISDVMMTAKDNINHISESLEAAGVKKPSHLSLGNPDYDFSELRSKKENQLTSKGRNAQRKNFNNDDDNSY